MANHEIWSAVRGGAALASMTVLGAIGGAIGGETLTSQARSDEVIAARECLQYIEGHPEQAGIFVSSDRLPRVVLDACGFGDYSTSQTSAVGVGKSNVGAAVEIHDFSVLLPDAGKLGGELASLENITPAAVGIGLVGGFWGLGLGLGMSELASKRKKRV